MPPVPKPPSNARARRCRSRLTTATQCSTWLCCCNEKINVQRRPITGGAISLSTASPNGLAAHADHSNSVRCSSMRRAKACTFIGRGASDQRAIHVCNALISGAKADIPGAPVWASDQQRPPNLMLLTWSTDRNPTFGVRNSSAALIHVTSITASISTVILKGNEPIPTAQRACLPRSPNTWTKRSEQPLMTFG